MCCHLLFEAKPHNTIFDNSVLLYCAEFKVVIFEPVNLKRAPAVLLLLGEGGGFNAKFLAYFLKIVVFNGSWIFLF